MNWTQRTNMQRMKSLDENTLIQIFYDRIGEKRYMAFDLFIYALHGILKKKNEKTQFIHDIKNIEKSEKVLLVMYLNDLGKYVKHYGFQLPNSKMEIIFIHADFVFNHSKYDQKEINQFVNIRNPEKCVVLEYSSQNICYYAQCFPKIQYYFLPLLYDESIEDFYNSRLGKVGKIPWNKKDIDILFFGDISERRKNFFAKIQDKYKIFLITGNNNFEEMVRLIERCKIFVNPFSKDTNQAFDYFRLALLYSNRVFVITETPKVNFKIEQNLIDLKNVIITSDYDNMEKTIENYIHLPQNEIENITTQTYNEFKKFTMRDSINDFFSFQA